MDTLGNLKRKRGGQYQEQGPGQSGTGWRRTAFQRSRAKGNFTFAHQVAKSAVDPEKDRKKDRLGSKYLGPRESW